MARALPCCSAKSVRSCDRWPAASVWGCVQKHNLQQAEGEIKKGIKHDGAQLAKALSDYTLACLRLREAAPLLLSQPDSPGPQGLPASLDQLDLQALEPALQRVRALDSHWMLLSENSCTGYDAQDTPVGR